MSVSIEFVDNGGTDGPFQLASNNGWTLVVEWANKLPAKFNAVKKLCQDGEVEDTAELSSQLNDALISQYAPSNENVYKTLAELCEVLGQGAEEELAVVTS